MEEFSHLRFMVVVFLLVCTAHRHIYSTNTQSISFMTKATVSAVVICHHYSLICQCGVDSTLLPSSDCGVSQKSYTGSAVSLGHKESMSLITHITVKCRSEVTFTQEVSESVDMTIDTIHV